MTEFLLKILKLEYYFSNPHDAKTLPYSELLGKTCDRLPIIRCFGSSPSGEILCGQFFFILMNPKWPDSVIFQINRLIITLSGDCITKILIFAYSFPGQKLCAHIHGVCPYLFVEYSLGVDSSDAKKLIAKLRTIAQKLDEALSKRSGICDGRVHIFDVQPLSAR